MNLNQNIYLIRVLLIFIFFFSCMDNEKKCNEESLINKLIKHDISNKKTPFQVYKIDNNWHIELNKEEVYESRFAYKIFYSSESEHFLLNHEKVNFNELTEKLYFSYIELSEKRFKKIDIENLPNVGFEVIVPKRNHSDISHIICQLYKSKNNVEIKLKQNNIFSKNRFDKLMQLRFTFYH